MTLKKAYIKLAIAVVLDIADFTIGRLVGAGTAFDVILSIIGYIMFGNKGLVQLFEIIDVTDQIDGFIPTLTLLALYELREEKKKQS